MFNWLREYLSIRYEFREREIRLKKESAQTNIELDKEEEVCQSCETLRQQLEIANYEKSQILSKLLKEPEKVPDTPPVAVTRPRTIPWHVRRQMLETEDREKAKAMRNAAKPDSEIKPAETISTEELEKELGVAEQQRESEAVGQK
jgi:hypothetical protein